MIPKVDIHLAMRTATSLEPWLEAGDTRRHLAGFAFKHWFGQCRSPDRPGSSRADRRGCRQRQPRSCCCRAAADLRREDPEVQKPAQIQTGRGARKIVLNDCPPTDVTTIIGSRKFECCRGRSRPSVAVPVQRGPTIAASTAGSERKAAIRGSLEASEVARKPRCRGRPVLR